MDGRPRNRPGKKPFYYGWVMLVVAILGVFACYPGQTVGISVFNPYLRESLNLSLTELSGAYMLATFIAGGASLIVGDAADRWGLRGTITFLVVLMSGACLFMSKVTGLISVFFAFLMLRVLGHGAVPLLVDNTLAMWFHDRLGRVMGIKNMATAAAVAVVPGTNLWLIHSYGWRKAYIIWGVAVSAIMLPLMLFVFRNRPEEIGQALEGENDADVDDVTSGTENYQTPVVEFTLRTAIRTRAYWIVLALHFAMGMIWAGTSFNIVPLLGSHGLTEGQAATTLSVFAVMMAVTLPIAGSLADRTPLNRILSVGCASVAIALTILIASQSFWIVQGYAVLFGIGNGLNIVAASTLWPRYYGRLHLGKIKGGAQAAMVVGSSLGPFLIGASQDHLGSFDYLLYVFIGANVLLTIATVFATPPR